MTTFTCTRCEEEFPVDGERCGTEEKPYCRTCHMITFYNFPEDRLEKIKGEMGLLRRMGTPEEQLNKILWMELNRHANRQIKAKLEKVNGFWSDRLERQLRG